MRCSLCEKNECAGGVVCAACEAHYASLREGHVRRQSLQVGEHTLAHLAWSAVAVSPGKGKARDDAGGFFSFFRRLSAESLRVEAEEAPPPPDWKNRVRPAPDGLPPLQEADAEHEASPGLAAAASGALAEVAGLKEAHPLAPEAQATDALAADGAPTGPMAPPSGLDPLPPPVAPEEGLGPYPPEAQAPAAEAQSDDLPPAPPPALASFFESLGGEASPVALPTATEAEPTPDAADLMSGFLASLAAPTEAPAASPGASTATDDSGDWALESPMVASNSPDGLRPPASGQSEEAPASVSAVDPSVFQSAELPALDWSLDASSGPTSKDEAPMSLAWPPEGQAAPSADPMAWPEGPVGSWAAPSTEALPLAQPTTEAPSLGAIPEAASSVAPPLGAPLGDTGPIPAPPAAADQEVAASGAPLADSSPELAIAFDFLAGLRGAPEASDLEALAPPQERPAPSPPSPEGPPPSEAAAPPSLAGVNFFEGLAATAQAGEAKAPGDAPPASPSEATAPSPQASALGDFFASLESPAAEGSATPSAEGAANDPLAGFFADLQVGESAPAPSPAAPQDPSSLSWKLDQAFAAMASPAQPQAPDGFPPAPLASQFQREALPKEAPREGGSKPGGGPFTIDLGAGAKAPAPPPLAPAPHRPVPQDPRDGAFSFVRDDDEEAGLLDLGASGGLLEGLRFQPEGQGGGFSYTPKPSDDDEDEGRTIEL